MQLRKYQSEAVEHLKEATEHLLRSVENEILIFQAPTGSGKTIVMADYLKKIVVERKDERKFSFIWISVRKLHDQSKDKLEKYYENDKLLACSYFEDLQDNRIAENEILFVNWQSINKKDINIYVRENELDNNLKSIIQNTKDDGRDIMLIIDESHHTASSEKSKELIELISPKITIEVSATPQLKDDVSDIVKVFLNDVKDEEMIKTEIAVNPEFKKLKIGSKSGNEVVIQQAIEKREELKRMFSAEGSRVNPLILVQLPDKKEGVADKQVDVIRILKDLGITEENGKLAIWLSEDKSDTLPNIDKNDNEVEVLIFKQAIALGWDCPRASILVIFRELKSFTFTIQTIGRIMRMPDLKHYSKHPELNRGFVFTNLATIEIAEDYVKDYITLYESKRRNDLYKNINLNSFYLKRQRERTRLSGQFAKIFMSVAEQTNLKGKITIKPNKIVDPVISDGKIVDIDRTGQVKHDGVVDISLTEKELQNRFDNFVSSNCTPFAPRDSSDRMKTALYQFLMKEFKSEKYEPDAQKIILEKENVQYFIDTINLSKERYRVSVIKELSEKREVQDIPGWEVPVIISYNSRHAQMDYDQSIMEPLFLKKLSDPERDFMKFLSKQKKIKWWFRNGENEVKYFALPYVDDNGYERSFYPDFIIALKDQSIGLFDTKSGMTAKEAGPRAEGLRKYIQTENKRGKKLIGGILISSGGTWLYNDDTKYHFDPKNLSTWKLLELQ